MPLGDSCVQPEARPIGRLAVDVTLANNVSFEQKPEAVGLGRPSWFVKLL